MDGMRDWLYGLFARLRRIERREWRDFRRWLERTHNIVQVSVLLFVPFLIWLVTLLSNQVDQLSFLLFPPLAAGSYTLFANPESKYASPWRFVAGITLGAVCGWIALELGGAVVGGSTGLFSVNAVDAAISVLLTGVVTWALDVQEASAFSTALLALLLRPGQEPAFVVSVVVASLLVASVFYVWRENVYDRRGELLYESTKGDDRVLVPMRGQHSEATAMFGARIAAAHEAGKVVLLDLVDDDDVAAAERDLLDDRRRARADLANGTDGDGPDPVTDSPAGANPEDTDADESDTETDTRYDRGGTDGESGRERGADNAPPGTDDEVLDPGELEADEDIEDLAEKRAVSEAATSLEMRAAEIETRVGVPTQVVVTVTSGAPAATVLQTAGEVNCDLVATPYEQHHGGLSPFVRELFDGRLDVAVHRSRAGRTRWKDVLVPVRRASDVAHGMLDFATRLAGETGRLSAATCVSREGERRRAESMLADLVETFSGTIETRVAKASIEDFLERTGPQYDLVIMGASTDRSAASRFISPPTFERIQDVDTDVAIIDRN
jgi:hypothetical protein